MSGDNLTSSLPLFILAGGFGTRLHSVLGDFPKALAPVQERPFLALQLECWLKQGINSFVFLLHHQADLIIQFLKSEEDKLLKNCNVQYFVEPNPMGTGGAVAFAIEQMSYKGDFLLANADTWLGFWVDQMVGVASPAILVVKVEDVGRYGEVIFNNDFLVTKFLEKKPNNSAGWINAGISRMSASFFKDWNGQPFSLEGISFPKFVENRYLRAVTLDSEFIDIGIPQDYSRFCKWIESGRVGQF